MQPLPKDFLEAIAKVYDLSPEQTEALVKRLGDKDGEVYDAKSLNIEVSALRSRMSIVYTKFGIGGKGPGKLRRLHDFLLPKCPVSQPTALETKPDINVLVQQIRTEVHGHIQYRCGTMRVLDMDQPISVSDIYTDVNILEELSGHRGLEIDELLDSSWETFDRFMLGQVREKRVPGLEAVQRYDKLMILGKPGSGKTTFIKRLAILCNQGEFQADQIPIFVTLKEFAEEEGQPKLQAYIAQQWKLFGVDRSSKSLFKVLQDGRALLLLDGLDEVRKIDQSHILREIKYFTETFHKCRFVITCRIAAWKYILVPFKEVEIADFNLAQIRDFGIKWFKARKNIERGNQFVVQIEENQPIQELGTTPILLTLLCLVFEGKSYFPPNRAELYRESFALLLKKWDVERNIERDQIYKKLSPKRKEDLLSQLAFETFKQGEYFFKQEKAEQQVVEYIRRLPGANEDEEVLQLDGEAVLKSIEAQHGLLIERSKSIYSFSHLTFHEFLTASKIVENQDWTILIEHITFRSWQEVWPLAFGLANPCDDLAQALKEHVDGLVAQDKQIQGFLHWVNDRATSAPTSPYKAAVIRLFYLARAFNFDFARILGRGENLPIHQALENDLNSERTLALAKEFKATDSIQDSELNFGIELGRFLHYAKYLESDFFKVIREFKNSLPDLEDQPNLEDKDEFEKEWKAKGELWNNQLKQIILGNSFYPESNLFSEAQVELLRQYYKRNELLIKCMNMALYLSHKTRNEIEATLLLPYRG